MLRLSVRLENLRTLTGHERNCLERLAKRRAQLAGDIENTHEALRKDTHSVRTLDH
jgi:hypothetical protein